MDEGGGGDEEDVYAVRAERRRKSLMNLIGENQNVISNIKAGMVLSSSGSNSSLKSVKLDARLTQIKESSLSLEKEPTSPDHTEGDASQAPPPPVASDNPCLPANIPIIIEEHWEATQEDSDKSEEVPVVQEESISCDQMQPIVESEPKILNLTEQQQPAKAKKATDDQQPQQLFTVKEEDSGIETQKEDPPPSSEVKVTGTKPKIRHFSGSTMTTSGSPPANKLAGIRARPVPAIVIPHTSRPFAGARGRLDKARSVSPSSCVTHAPKIVSRQFSVPTR